MGRAVIAETYLDKKIWIEVTRNPCIIIIIIIIHAYAIVKLRTCKTMIFSYNSDFFFNFAQEIDCGQTLRGSN